MSKLKTFAFRFFLALIIIALLAVGTLTFVATYFKNKIVLPPTVTAVSVLEVSEKNFVGDIKASGFVNAKASGNLYTQAPGKVQSILVKPGESVKKGQVLLSLDNDSELSSLAALKANLNVLKLNYEGLLSVYKKGGVSKVQVEQAHASYNQLLSQVKSSEEAIAKKTIVAPYDGLVGSINTSIGSLVQAGQTLVTVFSHGAEADTFVNLGVSPSLLKQLSVGNKAFVVDDNDKNLATGSIEAIDPVISPATGLSKVRVSFTNQELIDGQFVKVNVTTNPLVDRIVIPDIAIYYSLYGQTVYKVIPLEDSDRTALDALVQKATTEEEKAHVFDNLYKVKEIFIESSQRFNNVALIDKGLTVGDVIVTNGDISDGSYIRVVPGYGLGIPNTFQLPPYAQPQNRDK